MSPRALAAPLCLAFFALVGCGPIDLETMGADEADLGQTLRLFKSTDAPTTPAANDGSSVELGVKWRSDVDGQLLGVRFYKGPGNGGAHTGTLWTASGQRLATAAFGQETTAGWQRVRFAQPVQVRAGEVYVASYHAPAGHYAYSYGAFRGAGIDRGPLHALASGASGANGVFRYASSVAFPDQSYRDTNYWVDVIFAPAQVAPPVVDAGTVTPPVVDAGAVTPPVVDAGAVTPPVVDAGTVTPPPSGGYPDQTNTGARGTLTVHQGPLTVSTNGAVLENVEVRGRLTIAANDVTVRNVKVVTDDFWVVMVNGSRALLTDSTFIGGDNSQAALAGAGWVGRRLDLSGAGDGIKMHDGGELYDSYIHDLSNAAGAHNDGIEAGGPVKIVHNTILNRRSQTSCIMLSEYGANPDTDVLIQNNLLGGAGFTVYGGAPDTARGHEVRDNKFTTRFFPQSGYYGPVAYWSPAGNIWSGNVWADGPLAGQTVNP